ncbi:ras-related protein Rab-43-like isoform X2 [Glandiceps talaboti]
MSSHQRDKTDDTAYDFLFKIILIGDMDVGKSSIVKRFKSGKFLEKQQNTIGVDFTVKTLCLGGKKVKVWDTAGQERFRAMTRSYYNDTHGVIITYDITRKKTFDSIPVWLDEVKNNIGEKSRGGDPLVLLIGNKSDLSHQRQIHIAKAKQTVKQYDMLDCIETSAKDSTNVEGTFKILAKVLMKRHGGGNILDSGEESLTLSQQATSEVYGYWGCCGY